MTKSISSYPFCKCMFIDHILFVSLDLFLTGLWFIIKISLENNHDFSDRFVHLNAACFSQSTHISKSSPHPMHKTRYYSNNQREVWYRRKDLLRPFKTTYFMFGGSKSRKCRHGSEMKENQTCRWSEDTLRGKNSKKSCDLRQMFSLVSACVFDFDLISSHRLMSSVQIIRCNLKPCILSCN